MIPGVSEKQNVVEIASEIEQTAARYFSSVTLVNAGVGVSVWILVGLLGLPHPLLWGVAAFLLHYIPFVGATGGIAAMTLVSLIHFDSVWYALLPPLAYVFCAMIEGNLATPLFLGRWLTLNPIAILLTFLLWSYLWGVAGTLLAVPSAGDLQDSLRTNRATAADWLIPRTTLGKATWIGDAKLGIVLPLCSVLALQEPEAVVAELEMWQ